MWRAVTLLLKKPAQKLITTPKAHHNMNLSNQSSKRPCHTSSLATAGRGQGYTLLHVEKGSGTQFVRKKTKLVLNHHYILPVLVTG